jgi:peptidoglycan hydrolase-like protein with peptidoglycan-binding domain
VLQACGVPKAGPVSGSPDCVAAQYDRQRSTWLSRLSGSADEEAVRPIEQQIALQAQLQKLGFLPPTQAIDGVYGQTTRAAIVAWQRANGRPGTGLIGVADATALGASPLSAPQPQSTQENVAPGKSTKTLTKTQPIGAASPTTLNNVSSSVNPETTNGNNIWVLYIAIAVMGSVLLGFIIWRKRAREKHQKFISDGVRKETYDTVSEHMRALVRKRFQTLRHDDYGNLLREPWEKEITYFMETVLSPRVQQLGYEEYAFYVTMQLVLRLTIDEWVKQQTGASESLTLGPNLTPTDYEQYCAGQLRLAGWSADTTKASGDQGTDIVAQKGDLRLVVQCKLYSHPVGNKAVQEIAAARAHERADYAAVVSNSRYTLLRSNLPKPIGFYYSIIPTYGI